MLKMHDPILVLSYRDLFVVVGGLETIIAMLCVFGRRLTFQMLVLSWLTASFAIYRLALVRTGGLSHCPCLGHLTEALRLSPAAADRLLNAMFAYLVVGNCCCLVLLWRNIRVRHHPRAPVGL